MSVQAWLNRIWYERASPPWWLMPLSLSYGAAAGARRYLYAKQLRKSTRIASPVVVVGNLSVGRHRQDAAGLLAGRTTAANLGFKPGVVTRGYGGSSAARTSGRFGRRPEHRRRRIAAAGAAHRRAGRDRPRPAVGRAVAGERGLRRHRERRWFAALRAGARLRNRRRRRRAALRQRLAAAGGPAA